MDEKAAPGFLEQDAPLGLLDAMMFGFSTGRLINELYRRHPELIGPVKDQFEELDLMREVLPHPKKGG